MKESPTSGFSGKGLMSAAIFTVSSVKSHSISNGEFFYFFKCPNCGQLYECGSHIEVYPIDQAPDGAIVCVVNDD